MGYGQELVLEVLSLPEEGLTVVQGIGMPALSEPEDRMLCGSALNLPHLLTSINRMITVMTSYGTVITMTIEEWQALDHEAAKN